MNNHFKTYGADTEDLGFDIDDDEDKYHRITVTNIDIITQDTSNNAEAPEKGDDSLLTRMENMVALSNTSDKTAKTANPTRTTENTKEASLISELTDDLQTGLQTLLLKKEMRDALAIGELNQEVLKQLVMAIIAPGTSEDGTPSTES